MARYHVNRTTGRVGPCRARKACPFGDMVEEHYPTREEAQKIYEQLMASQELTPPLQQDSLKSMDAHDLAHSLFNNLRALGLEEESFSETLELSSLLHAEQRRRNRGRHSTTPYIEHPLRVTLRLMKWGVEDPVLLKGGLLHDTVEDGAQIFVARFTSLEVTSEEEAREILLTHLEEQEGKEVASLVRGVTNPALDPEVKAKLTQEESHQIYWKHLEEEIKADPRVCLLKLSDFTDNAGSLHHTDVAGAEAKTSKQARKYLPCIPLFREALDFHGEALPLPHREKLDALLTSIEGRLEGLVEKYSTL